MKIMKKLISFLLVLVMMAGLSIPSYAATLDFSVIPSFENKTLRVTGISDAGRMLTFYVTDQGISAADMTFDNNFYAMHQETAGSGGSFDITMKLPDTMEEGVYKLIIGGLGANFDEASRSSEFNYMTSDGNAYILEAESASGLSKWSTKSSSLASGGGYVSLYDNSIDYDPSEAKITFNFNVEDAMEYDIFAIVSSTAGHMSSHSFSVNGDKYTSSTSFIGEQLYKANFTSYEWPAHWAKIRSNQPIGAGSATIEYQPKISSLFSTRLLAAIDAIYVVPSSWNWKPFELGTPVNENRIRLNFQKATLSSTSVERGGTLTASVWVQTPAKLDYNVPIWVEMRYKGELVAREVKFANSAMPSWVTNYGYKTALTIDVPTVAPDGEYEIYCGVGSSAGFANIEGEKCIGTVTIGELDDPNPDTLKISSAAAVQNGKTLDVSYTLGKAADEATEAKAFVRIWDGDVLWGVAETEQAVDVSTEGSAIAANLKLPSGMPAGEYTLELGFYNVNGTKTIGDMEIVSDKKNTYKPLSHGIYKSQKTGNHHFWYINQAGAAIWDGEPFVPIGGMYCPNILAGYSFTDPATNIANWEEDMREIDILVENGVTDLYLNSSINGSATWVWEYVLDYLDERGIRYGIQPNGGSGYTKQDSFYIFSNGGKVGTTLSADYAGNHTVTMSKSFTYIGSSEPNYAVYAVVNSSGSVVSVGKAEMTRGETSTTYDFKATVNVPASGTYSVYFTPYVNANMSVVNFWKYGEQMINHAEKFASKVAIGDGVRDIVDHATNESGYYNQNANARPYEDGYNELYRNWLLDKYETIGKLHTAWKNDDILDFAQASRIIPVYTSATDSNSDYKIVGYDEEKDSSFEFDGRTTQMWLDFIEFRDYAAAEFYNDLADAYKTKLDVPTVVKSVYFHQESFRNERLTGGLDGLGSESYAVGESVGQKHMVTYALSRQFAKTSWNIVTETNVEENTTGKHADAYGSTPTYENGKLVVVDPYHLGYGTKARMHANFDQLFDSGAKGIYDFVYSARHSGTIQEAYTYVYFNDHFKDYVHEGQPYDLDHFAWSNEYREKVNANIDTIANTPIEKNLLYFAPAAAYTNMGGPNRFSAAHIADHKWRNYSYKTTGTNSNYAVLLTDDPTIDAEFIAASFERGPLSTKQGVAFGNMLDTMDGDKVAIYLGFRHDLGTVPQLDKYFTGEFTYAYRNSKLVKVQVLDPGETGEVIYNTIIGNKPWAIRDGNLWIIAAEDWITTNGSGTLNYIDELGIFMDSEDMVMQDFDFQNEDGAVIESVEAGDQTLSVRIKNNTKDETDAVMYAASYDGAGNLLSVSKKTRTLFSGLNYIETDLLLDGSEASAKGFIWDKDMKPLTGVLEIK